MSENRVNIPKNEPTLYERRINTLRRIATLFRILGGVSAVLALSQTLNGQVIFRAWDSITQFVVLGALGGIILYCMASGFDFLADTGLIILSMKRETQYTSHIVKEVREGRERVN